MKLLKVVLLSLLLVVALALIAINVGSAAKNRVLNQQLEAVQAVLAEDTDRYPDVAVRKVAHKGVVVSGSVDTQQDFDRLRELIGKATPSLPFFSVQVSSDIESGAIGAETGRSPGSGTQELDVSAGGSDVDD